MTESEKLITSCFSDGYDEKSAPLNDLFEKGWRCQRELDCSNYDCDSDEAKSKIFSAIRVLKIVEQKLNELNLFSENEEIDDVSTGELRYFLLYALLGWLYQSKPSSPERRIDNVKTAASYFDKFLKLCASYGLYEGVIPKFKEDESIFSISCNSKAFSVSEAAKQRTLKIEEYKRKKDEEAKLKTLEELVNNGNATQEIERNFFLSKIKWWIKNAVDDLQCLYEEMNLLTLRRSDINERNEITAAESKSKPVAKMPLLLLTRDKLKKEVFGMGYPSIHTVTVDQFYENLSKKGCIPAENKGAAPFGMPTKSQEEEEKIAKERKEEMDDSDYVKSQRAMDDWKDMHKRGEGNRYNRS